MKGLNYVSVFVVAVGNVYFSWEKLQLMGITLLDNEKKKENRTVLQSKIVFL